jgi:formylglycine-generating enzyme required for sulfatase activity
MVWVPAGEFLMGSDRDVDAYADAEPVHQVRITRGFWLGRCEVTNAQYKKYCAEAGVQFPEDSNQGDTHPVAHVSWTDVAAYCRHYGLSLPTEAQWEYAAAGPEAGQYPWGNAWDAKKCGNWNNPGPGGSTWPVGSFPQGASWCGALDLAGNVWEWCQDWYDENYYAHSPAEDPAGPEAGTNRVLRGGSWSLDHGDEFRCAYRGDLDPVYRDDSRGCRCARTT